MNKDQVKHILDKTEEPEDQPQLVFTHNITKYTGDKVGGIQFQPSKWGNVKHLTGNLYYAYDDDDDDETGGSVFVGEFK